MHNNSHPEYKENQTAAAAGNGSHAVGAPGYLNEGLPLDQRLRLYIDTHAPVDDGRGVMRPFSMADAGREMGYSAGMVSKYLNKNLTGDKSAVEAAITDLLDKAFTRQTETHFTNLFLTSTSQSVEATFERIRKCDDIGLVCGPAGSGKTCGCHMYHESNPTSLFVTATRWKANPVGIESLLFDAVGKRGWSGFEPRMDYFIRKMRNSHRLVIIDNAHRLTRRALELVCDAQDENGFSVGLVGNEEVLETIRRSDQLLSRIGLKKPVFVTAPHANGKGLANRKGSLNFRQTVERMVELHAPDVNGSKEELVALGEIVAAEQGHLRALKKQLTLAKEIKHSSNLNYAESFRAAHTQLVRDYKLD